jgi:large subunit ribosomal protein L23
MFAKFLVPLWFNKLDLRDYLFHGYNVRAFNIRSHILQRPADLLYKTPHGRWIRKWHRVQSLKFMIIEMDKPFVWPQLEHDLSQGGYGCTMVTVTV